MADHIDIGPGSGDVDGGCVVVDEGNGDTMVLTVEGEAVRRSDGKRPAWLPALGIALAGALGIVAVGDVLSDVVGVIGADDDGSLDDLPVLTAEAENPGRYGLYQQNDPDGVGDGADSAYESSASPPPLPLSSPEAAFDPDVSLASHDGSIIAYMSSGSDGVLRARTGAGQELSAVPIGGGYELRSLSTDGSLAALWRLSPDAERLNVAVSDIVVVNTVIGELISRVRLEGLVEPEAFSTDGRVLFVLDSQVDVPTDSDAAGEPDQYRIRPLDLASGELGQMLGPTKDPVDEEMNGIGGRQIWGPTGTRLYTVYVRQNHSHGSESNGGSNDGDHQIGFVHVLDLVEEWAFCLRLPEGFGQGRLSSTALAVRTGGDIVVLDLQAGQVATASSETLAVERVADLPIEVMELLVGDGRGSLELAAAGKHLVVAQDRQALWLDAVSLEPVDGPVQLSGNVVGLTSGPRPLAWFGAGRPPLELIPPG